jgi:hypothetical protein
MDGDLLDLYGVSSLVLIALTLCAGQMIGQPAGPSPRQNFCLEGPELCV